jgi:protein-L-isoaspartate(D-aspartate) O-methyltransferase
MEVPATRMISWALVVGCSLAESMRARATAGETPSSAAASTPSSAAAPTANDGRATPVAEAKTPEPVATSDAADAADPAEAKRLRAELVRRLAAAGEITDEAVLGAMRRVPRHLFMPDEALERAYEDHANPIGHGQTISQPTVVAMMTEGLKLTGRERVLEIGTGSGYQAAILSLLAREVDSIEIIAALGRAAAERLHRLGYANVQVKIGDGYRGWPEKAPFDRVILTAAPTEVPQALFDQLADGGILVAPLGDEHEQYLYRWTKRDHRLERDNLGAVRFVPMVHGEEPPTEAPTRRDDAVK